MIAMNLLSIDQLPDRMGFSSSPALPSSLRSLNN
jgi:hypothetical protein